VSQHVDLHVMKTGSLQRLVPPGGIGRMLPAPAHQPDGVLQQPHDAWESATGERAQLAAHHTTVARAHRVEREHHVPHHQASTGLQDASDLGKRALLLGIAQLVQAVVGNHKIGDPVDKRKADSGGKHGLDVVETRAARLDA